MKNTQEISRTSLEEEINMIFKIVTQQFLKPKAISKVKAVMKQQVKELITEALKRAILRDASMSVLEVCDLLTVINKTDDKYKTNVGNYLIAASSFKIFRGGQKHDDNGGDDGEDQVLSDDN